MNHVTIKIVKNEVDSAKSIGELEKIRIKYLGRKGIANKLLAKIKNIAPSKRKAYGLKINQLKKEIKKHIGERYQAIKTKKNKLGEEWLDVTAPGIKPPQGHLHLVSQAISEISRIFERIGFIRARYPEVEWDWYAFEALNMPKNHPARDEWETFFIDAPPHFKFGKMVLTPHTSSGQIREMLHMGKPPIRMINIAKCYRKQLDNTHLAMFYQFEGLAIDKNINITHLKGVLDYFAKQYFGPKRKTRIRPHHFRFTEPSFEVDISCGICGGKGCPVCKEGWVEIGGSGMVHPKVLKNGGIDSKKYTGFAFGWGVERVLMMKAGLKLNDIRLLYANDLRFLKQF